MELSRLAKRVRDSWGLQHSANLNTLRHYVKITSEDSLAEQIKDITEVALLRTLWEAGLSARLQDVVLKQIGKPS